MLKTVFNKFLMVLYFIIGALVFDALSFLILDFGFMPEYFWYNFALILIIAFTVYIIPNYTAQFIIYSIILLGQGVLLYVNYSLTKVYGGELFSFEMFKLAREATEAITSNFIYIFVILILIAIFTLVFLFGLWLLKYCRKFKINIKNHFSIFNVILIASVELFGIGFSLSTRNNINSTTNIYDYRYVLTDEFKMNTSYLKTASYKKFGTYGYFINLLFNNFRNDLEAVDVATREFFNSGKIYGTEGNSSKVFGADKGNNVIVFMMESTEWFGFGDGTYDPAFENLIYVDNQLSEKTLTPNITKLIYGENYLSDLSNTNEDDDAMRAKNFFAKSKTNISEGQGILGSYPLIDALTELVQNETKSTFDYSMPSVLRDLGYKTSYFHSHNLNFYSRNKTHKYIGFDTAIGKDGLIDDNGNPLYQNIKFGQWTPEADLVKNAMEYIVPSDRTKPFYSFYLNVSTHGSYKAQYQEENGDAIRYYNYIKWGDDDCELDDNGNWKLKDGISDPTPTLWYKNVLTNYPSLSEELVYYQCGIKGFDEAVGVIVNKLKEYNIFDTTTMLFYSDHNAYFDDLSYIVKSVDTNPTKSQQANIIPMFIVSPGLKKYNATSESKFVINTRFSSAYDVVPTLFDLLGVKFNENLYIGHSLFRPADYIYSHNGVIKDMVVYYSNTGGLFGDGVVTYDLENFTIDDNYSESALDLFKAEALQVLTKLNYIGYMNKYDLFHKLNVVSQ